MFHEYALDPKVVATWGDPQRGRLIVGSFGIGTGRLPSNFPDDWPGLVMAAFDEAAERRRKSGRQAARLQQEHYNLVEVLQRLRETAVIREDYRWQELVPWIHNALAEHARFPFHAILSDDGPAGHPVMRECDCGYQNEQWSAPRGCTVQRSPEELVSTVSPYLAAGLTIRLVDPHLNPEMSRYRRVLELALRVAFGQRLSLQPPTVEIHTLAVGSRSHFLGEYQEFLAPLVPTGRVALVFRWREKPGGEKLHNRFVLTELGGVLFGAGLDYAAKDPGASDDIVLLDVDQFRKRWSQYCQGSCDFELEEGRPLVVHGTAASKSR